MKKFTKIIFAVWLKRYEREKLQDYLSLKPRQTFFMYLLCSQAMTRRKYPFQLPSRVVVFDFSVRDRPERDPTKHYKIIVVLL